MFSEDWDNPYPPTQDEIDEWRKDYEWNKYLDLLEEERKREDEKARKNAKRLTVGISIIEDGHTETAGWYNWCINDVYVETGTNIDWDDLERKILSQMNKYDTIYVITVTGHGRKFTKHVDDQEMKDFLDSLKERMHWVNKGVRLNSCQEALSQSGRDDMVKLAVELETEVVGWDDWYAVVPHGKEYTATPDGNITQTGDTGLTYYSGEKKDQDDLKEKEWKESRTDIGEAKVTEDNKNK